MPGGRKQVLEGDTSLEHASEKWVSKKLPLSGATKKRTFRSGEGMALKGLLSRSLSDRNLGEKVPALPPML